GRLRRALYDQWWEIQDDLDALAEAPQASLCLSLMKRQAELASSYLWADSETTGGYDDGQKENSPTGSSRLANELQADKAAFGITHGRSPSSRLEILLTGNEDRRGIHTPSCHPAVLTNGFRREGSGSNPTLTQPLPGFGEWP